MDINRYKEITEKLRNTLNEKRYIHTIGVAYTAASMAMKHGVDTDRALLAGLLHDCAKCFSYEESLKLCEEGNVELTQTEIDNPALIHAKLGVYIAERDFDVHDEEILAAIRSHTTGEPGMSDLAMIIFLADLIEPGRSAEVIPGLDEFRKMAFEDLPECVYIVTKHQLEYLEKESGKTVDPTTRATYYFYRDYHEKRSN